jgi:hypothetical protein
VIRLAGYCRSNGVLRRPFSKFPLKKNSFPHSFPHLWKSGGKTDGTSDAEVWKEDCKTLVLQRKIACGERVCQGCGKVAEFR